MPDKSMNPDNTTNNVIPEILDIAHIALHLQKDDQVLTEADLVSAVLMHPKGRSVALELIPYTENELPATPAMPSLATKLTDPVSWPESIEFEDNVLEFDEDAEKVRDSEVFTSLEAFIGKLYRVTPEAHWYRQTIASSFQDLRIRVDRAVDVCSQLLPAHKVSIRKLSQIILDRGSQSLDGVPSQRPAPIFIFSHAGHGATTLLRTMAKELGCRFLNITGHSTGTGDLIQAAEDKPPMILEVTGFLPFAQGSAVQSILSYFVNGQSAQEQYCAESDPLSLLSSEYKNADDLDQVLNRCVVVFHVEPPPDIADLSIFTPEDLATLLRNRQREEIERNPTLPETPSFVWGLMKDHNSIVLKRTPCRHMVHAVAAEMRKCLEFLRVSKSEVTLTVESKLKTSAVMILEHGYPTPRDLSGAARRLIYATLDAIADRGAGLTGEYTLRVEATNGHLPAILSKKVAPTNEWFHALETQARQQVYSGRRLRYELEVNHEARTVTLSHLTLRAPQAIEGGSFLVTTPKQRFSDVIGMDDAKERLQTLVRYFNHPDSFTQLDTVPPKRILLAGPPGTGKTMLAKAFAGEIGLPFFSVSAAEIMSQKWAGWGAAKLRELFQAASVYRPSVIFLDELDAFGSRETMGDGETAMDQKSILNTLLVLLDGVDSSEDIIVLGATNRPDDLDAALTRPKRFGTRIDYSPLTSDQRSDLIKLNLDEAVVQGDYQDVVDYIAMRTAGPFSPVEIEEIINESKLAAERGGHKKVSKSVAATAIDSVVLGKKFKELSPDCRLSTAYHEAGHAIVMKALLPNRKISRLTIGARANSMGLLSWAEDETQMHGITFCELVFTIMQLLGGVVAEAMQSEIHYPGTGGSSDLGLATRLSKWCVEDCGLGLGIRGAVMGYLPSQEDPWPPELYDQVCSVMAACHSATKDLLESLKDPLKTLAETLAKQEDMGEEEVVDALGCLMVDRNAVLQEVLKQIPHSSISRKEKNE